ncbi:MAG: hypothetical protein HY906_20225 [Deltaproteobacteria bacterium]|nr:hypothetical protein [Deltaproteobacteria bacterium]
MVASPKQRFTLTEPGFYEVRFLSGGNCTPTGDSSSNACDFVDTYLADVQKDIFDTNIIMAVVNSVLAVPWVGDYLNGPDGPNWVQFTAKQALASIASIRQISREDLEAAALALANQLLATVANAVSGAGQAAKKKLVEWLAIGVGEAAGTVVTTIRAGASAGVVAHRLVRLYAPESIMEYYIISVAGPKAGVCTLTDPPSCATDSDCFLFPACVDGTCVMCRVDSDCWSSNDKCIANTCRIPCLQLSDCASNGMGWICSGGLCGCTGNDCSEGAYCKM